MSTSQTRLASFPVEIDKTLITCSFFQGHVNVLLENSFSDYFEYVVRDPILFGDFRNALTEEPRVYEDVVDYEATKAIFEEVRSLFITSANENHWSVSLEYFFKFLYILLKYVKMWKKWICSSKMQGLAGSGRSQMFFKICVLKNFENFTGKHLCWSLIIKLQAFKVFKYTFFYRTPPFVALSLLCNSIDWFLYESKTDTYGLRSVWKYTCDHGKFSCSLI